MNFEAWIQNVKEQEMAGKKPSQISIETYIQDKFHMEIVEVKELPSDYEDKFEILATNGVNEYLFLFEFYEIQELNIWQNILMLKEVRGKEGVFKTEQKLWLTKETTPQNKYLHAPLSALLSNSLSNDELNFVVKYLVEACTSLNGFDYKELKENDIESFVLSVQDLKITVGFSNTIQVDFKRQYLSFQIVYKERNREELIRELNDVTAFISSFSKNNVLIGSHSLSDLSLYLKEQNHYGEVITNSIVKPDTRNKVLIISPFVIGEYDSYHQVQVHLYYNREIDVFEIEVNYMFRNFNEICNSVQEVQKQLEKLVNQFAKGDC